MHVDALDALAIDVAAEMGAFVYDEAPLPLLMGKMGECGSEKAGANDEIVVFFI